MLALRGDGQKHADHGEKTDEILGIRGKQANSRVWPPPQNPGRFPVPVISSIETKAPEKENATALAKGTDRLPFGKLSCLDCRVESSLSYSPDSSLCIGRSALAGPDRRG